MKNADILDNQMIIKDEHYLCKYGFIVLNKTQDRAWTGSSNIFLNTINLKLLSDDFEWEVKEVKQNIEIDKVQFTHLTGIIHNRKGVFDRIEIKTRRKLFSFFREKDKIENFYSFQKGEQILKNSKATRQILLEFRDKDIEISTTGGRLDFSFFFNSYFTDEYYDLTYKLLSEVSG